MRSESMFRRCEGLLVVLLALGTWLLPSASHAAGRVALVVGNSAYAEIGTLPNPGNDAADVASALGRLGFEVETVRDADRAGMNAALRGFTRRSVGADVALVFYAGHGLEMDGLNYLVPVDARLERDTDVRFEAVALDDVLASVEGAALRVVILDACRNNPLARSMQLTSASRSVSRGSFGELNEDLLGAETLVAYAAAAGTTAADGTGRNSPYTAALLSFLEQPLELSALFRRVRGQVLDATSGAQRPHEYGSLLGEHYLGGASGPGTVTVVDSVSSPALAQQETVFWESIRDSSNPAEFEAYLRQFPAGVFRALATVRLAALRGPAADAPGADRLTPPSTLIESRNSPFSISLVPTVPVPIRIGATLGFRLSSSTAGYASLYLIDPVGQVLVLAENLPLSAGSIEYPSPAGSFTLAASEPVGFSRVVLLVTRQPLDGFTGNATSTNPSVLVTLRGEAFVSQLNRVTSGLPRSSWAVDEVRVRIGVRIGSRRNG